MSKIKNSELYQYGTEPFEQQQFGTPGVEGVKLVSMSVCNDFRILYHIVLTSHILQSFPVHLWSWLPHCLCVPETRHCESLVFCDIAAKGRLNTDLRQQLQQPTETRKRNYAPATAGRFLYC